MKVESILVVCVGNICRSPVGERLLARGLPGVRVSSAGLGAVVGAPVDPTMAKVATSEGLDVSGHSARQFTKEIAAEHDLILVLEPEHRRSVMSRHPELSGKTLLLDQWKGAKGIPDPYRRPEPVHRAAFEEIRTAAEDWIAKLS